MDETQQTHLIVVMASVVVVQLWLLPLLSTLAAIVPFLVASWEILGPCIALPRTLFSSGLSVFP